MTEQSQIRRRWIVNPRYQIGFASMLVLLYVNLGFLYQVALYYRTRSLVSEAGSVEAFLRIDAWTVVWPAMLAAGSLGALVVFFLGVRYSHQIVGPLPRITRALRAIAAGEKPQRLQFRPGDVLRDLADEVNRVADAVESGPEAARSVDPAPVRSSEAIRREPVHS